MPLLLFVQVKNALALLPSPYLHNGLMVVINQTTQMVDSSGRPVPLNEVQPAVLASVSRLDAGADCDGVEHMSGCLLWGSSSDTESEQ